MATAAQFWARTRGNGECLNFPEKASIHGLRYKRCPVCSGFHKVVAHVPLCTPCLTEIEPTCLAIGCLVMWFYLTNLLIAGNVGVMIFFTVAVAPAIFTALPPEWSAAFVRKFFPRYFFFLGITTTAAFGSPLASTAPVTTNTPPPLKRCIGSAKAST